MPDQLTRHRVTSCAPTRMRRPVGPLHVFLRHHATRTQVSALSGCGCPSASPESAPPICKTLSVSRRGYARRPVGRGARSSSTSRYSSTPTPPAMGRGATGADVVGLRFNTALRHATGIGRIHRRPTHAGHRRRGDAASLRAADNADRIINDVLPMLGLDVARLSA